MWGVRGGRASYRLARAAGIARGLRRVLQHSLKACASHCTPSGIHQGGADDGGLFCQRLSVACALRRGVGMMPCCRALCICWLRSVQARGRGAERAVRVCPCGDRCVPRPSLRETHAPPNPNAHSGPRPAKPGALCHCALGPGPRGRAPSAEPEASVPHATAHRHQAQRSAAHTSHGSRVTGRHFGLCFFHGFFASSGRSAQRVASGEKRNCCMLEATAATQRPK